MNALVIRDALHADLPTIVSIYNAAIPGRLATADLTPVTVVSREPWFAAHSPQSYPLLVAENGGTIAGWGALNLFYGRLAYQRTAEIAVYVDPQFARKGIGQRLTEDLLAHSKRLGFKTLLAFIFAHNQPSIRLFIRNGFELWGHLPGIADMDEIERDLDIYGFKLQ